MIALLVEIYLTKVVKCFSVWQCSVITVSCFYFQFDPLRELTAENNDFNRTPSLSDKVHCLVFVLPADTITQIPDEINIKMKEILKKARELGESSSCCFLGFFFYNLSFTINCWLLSDYHYFCITIASESKSKFVFLLNICNGIINPRKPFECPASWQGFL